MSEWNDDLDLEQLPGTACIWRFHENDAFLIKANQRYKNQFRQSNLRKDIPILQNLLESERQELSHRLACLTSVREAAIHHARRAIRADGSNAWIQIQSSYLGELGGDPVYLSLLHDITGHILLQKQVDEAKEATAQLNAKLCRLYDSIPCGFATVRLGDDGGLTLLSANKRFFEITGHTESLLSEKQGFMLNQLDGDKSESLSTLIGAGDLPCRWNIRRIDGGSAWVSLNLVPDQQEGVQLLTLTEISGLVKAENVLTQNEFYQSLLDRSKAGGILVRRAVGGPEPLYMSKNISLTLGYEHEELMELLSKDYMGLLPPEDAQEYRKELQGALYRIGEYSNEYRVLKKDGTPMWVSDTTLLEHCPDGTPVFFSVLTDATRHKEDEERLRTREEEYRLAAAQSGRLVYRFNLSDAIMDIPEDVARSFGLPAKIEQVPDVFFAMESIAPECEEDCRGFFKAMLRGEPNGQVAVRTRLGPEGEYRWLLSKFTMVYSSAGRPVSAVGTVEDITVQKEQEHRLAHLSAEQELLRMVAMHTGRTVFKYDIQTHTAYLGEEIAKWFGLSPMPTGLTESALRLDQVAKESRNEYLSFFRAIERGEPSGRTIIRRRNIYGDYFWFQVDFSTVEDAAGKPSYAVVSFADVSERYEMELAYRQYQQKFTHKDPLGYTYLAFNLTQSRCDQEEGLLLGHIRSHSDGTLDGMVQSVVERCISPESETEFRRFNNRTRLLNAYLAGVREDQVELLALINQEKRWVREHVWLFEDPYSSDVRAVFSIMDIDEKKRERLSLLKRADYDGLTGLLNRAAFQARVEERCRDGQSAFAILLLDIDHFKTVNNTRGHIQSNQFLVKLGEMIGAMLRPNDLLARLGGDEFGLCLANIADAELAARRAKQICEAVQENVTSTLSATVSIGMSIFPQDGASFEELYEKADTGLFAVKEKGGNSFACISAGGKGQKLGEKRTRQRLFIRTFGYFDIFIGTVPLSFSSPKAKELLAILVDRRGGILTSGEAISLLWEDEPQNQTTLARYRKIALRLKRILDEAGVGDLLVTKTDGRCVNVSKFDCDYYQYMDSGDKDLFRGSYMSNYSWSETTLSELLKSQERGDK